MQIYLFIFFSHRVCKIRKQVEKNEEMFASEREREREDDWIAKELAMMKNQKLERPKHPAMVRRNDNLGF